jgi:hypothetical protein
MQQLDYNNGRAVFSTSSVPRGYKRDEVWSLVLCGSTGGRGMIIAVAVTRKRLVTLCEHQTLYSGEK